MNDHPIININLDRKCSKCGAKGALDNGICLKCLTKSIKARRTVRPPHPGARKHSLRTKKNRHR